MVESVQDFAASAWIASGRPAASARGDAGCGNARGMEPGGGLGASAGAPSCHNGASHVFSMK